MKEATLRFYAELNDFLPPERRGRPFQHVFQGTPSVKDLIEALGVPHTEVDLILVDGESVGFEQRILGGERISVYPMFETIDIEPLLKVRPQPLRVTRFALDTHLGRLSAYLRMLGFDAWYSNEADDRALAMEASEHRRILLTKDRGLLKRSVVTRGYYVRAIRPLDQVVEVLDKFDLWSEIRPFRRCMRCNAALVPVSKEQVWELLPRGVQASQEHFKRCEGCGRIYWRGTHFERMQRLIAQLLSFHNKRISKA